jgi:allantoinase
MSDFDLTLRGDIVLPHTILKDGHIAISEGRIVRVGEGAPPSAREAEDFRGLLIMPGAIDGQTHSTNQLDHEGLGMASRAAAAGGITAFIDMPYDEPAPITDAARFAVKATEIARDAHTDIGLYATIAPEQGTAQIPGLIEAGACAFKFSTFEAHPTRFPRITDDLLYECFRLLASANLLCSVHNQDQEITTRNMQAAQARGDTKWDAFGRALPPLVEDLATARVFELGALTGARSHAVHVSTARGFQLARMYAAAGHHATAETCVQYLMLNEEDHVRRLGAKVKHYPPIRPQAETERLWVHLAAGDCAFVSSDHAAWALAHKSDENFFRNASGGPGLETLLPAFFTGCQAHGLGPSFVANLLSEGPARAFNLAHKGRIAPGLDADFAILEPGSFTHDASHSLSAVQWSAFDGTDMAVRVRATYLRGAPVWDGARIVNPGGTGRLLRPEPRP